MATVIVDISGKKKFPTKRAMEMVIKLHLGIPEELHAELDLKLYMIFMSSEKNKVNVLTRVKKHWLETIEDILSRVATAYRLECTELRSSTTCTTW